MGSAVAPLALGAGWFMVPNCVLKRRLEAKLLGGTGTSRATDTRRSRIHKRGDRGTEKSDSVGLRKPSQIPTGYKKKKKKIEGNYQPVSSTTAKI